MLHVLEKGCVLLASRGLLQCDVWAGTIVVDLEACPLDLEKAVAFVLCA